MQIPGTIHYLSEVSLIAGSSIVGLMRRAGGPEIGGSNPLSPTNSDILKIQRRLVARSLHHRRGFF